MRRHLFCITLVLALCWSLPAMGAKIAHYTFEEAAGSLIYDTSGNGFDGTADGVDWVDGYFGLGLEFDGSSYVELPGEDMGLTAEVGSIAFWVNSGEPSGINTMFWGGDNTTGGGFGAENELHIHLESASANVWAGGEVGFYIQGTGHLASDPDSAIGSAPVNPIQINDEQWHHIACIWNNGDMTMYIDGDFVHDLDGSSVDFDMTYIYLGQMAAQSRYFTGLMDDVQIYDHALSETEVQLAMAGGVDPALPLSPTPADGEEDVALDASLNWTPGIYADSHDVYFGTSFDDVNDADRDNPGTALVSEGQADTTYTPEELVLDGVYYWRIDEVNEDPQDGIYRGPVWSFAAETTYMQTTPILATASSQVTEDNGPEKTIDSNGLDESDLHSDADTEMWKTAEGEIAGAWIQYEFEKPEKFISLLIWNYNAPYESFLGVGVQEATIETSLDGETWTDLAGTLTLNRGTGENGYAVNNTIDMGGVMAQYVKINVISNWAATPLVTSTGLSEVRFMTIPAAARRPAPESGSTLDSLYDSLSWRAGRGAEQHQLYLHTDEALVTAGDSEAFIGSLTERTYDLSDADLLYDETYFWKVVEVIGDEVIDGPVWDFNTPTSLVIDDMESYNNREGSRIFDIWLDGFDYDDNGSIFGYDVDGGPYMEYEIIFSGNQSGPFLYDTTNGESAAWAELELDGQNWTDGGIQQLSLFFLGDRDNDAGELYVKINNTTVTTDASLNSGIWRQWIIDLSEVSANLTQVDSITLGVNGANIEGLLYFDDICLYREAPDLAAATPEPPDSTALKLMYHMEDNLLDSSGEQLDGSSETTLFYTNSLDQGNLSLGRALSLDGVSEYVTVPVESLIPQLSDSTFCAWVSLDEDSSPSWQRVFDFGVDTTTYMFLTPRYSTNGTPQFGILSPDSASGDEQAVVANNALSDGWHHLAVTFAGTTLTLYVDGVMAASMETDTLPQDLGTTSNNWLGQSQFEADGFFAGLLDEFCIYGRALSAGEIRYLAGDR